MTTATDREPLTDRGRRTRETLLVAARSVFEEQGFGATRMGDIAAAAGVAHGTVYTYFETRNRCWPPWSAGHRRPLRLAARLHRARPVGADPRRERPLPGGLRRARQDVPGGGGGGVHRRQFGAVLERAHHARAARAAAIAKLQREGAASADLDPRTSAAALCAMVEGYAPGTGAAERTPMPIAVEPHRLWARALGIGRRGERMQFTEEHEQFRRSSASSSRTRSTRTSTSGRRPAPSRRTSCSRSSATLGLFGLEYDPEYGGGRARTTPSRDPRRGDRPRATRRRRRWPSPCRPTWRRPRSHRFGSAELKERYLRPAIAGEMVASIAVSEPDAGSDVAGIRTRAVRDGDDWVINGRKMWITNGAQADWLCLLARTSDEGGYRGMSPDRRADRHARVHGRPQARQAGQPLLGHRRAGLRRRAGARSATPSARSAAGFQQQMAQFQDERLIGAYMVGGAWSGRSTGPWTTCASARRSASRCSPTSTCSTGWPSWSPRSTCCRHYNYAARRAVIAGRGRHPVRDHRQAEGRPADPRGRRRLRAVPRRHGLRGGDTGRRATSATRG